MGTKTLMVGISAILVAAFGSAAWAVPVKSEMLKPRAYFVEADNNLLEALDLKAKTLSFNKKDSESCGQNMVRRAQTLTYSCTLTIPSKARISKLQTVKTAQTMEVNFGGTKREVQIRTANDGKTVTFTTGFDKTGIDFELSKFNDDFFAVYAKVAHLVITEAMNKPMKMEILESRQ